MCAEHGAGALPLPTDHAAHGGDLLQSAAQRGDMALESRLIFRGGGSTYILKFCYLSLQVSVLFCREHIFFHPAEDTKELPEIFF